MLAWPMHDIYGYEVPMGLIISPMIIYFVVYFVWWQRRKK